MNSNVRIGLCALGFFFPILVSWLKFGVFLDLGLIFGGSIIATIIFFVTRPRSPADSEVTNTYTEFDATTIAPVQQTIYQNIIQGDNITKTEVKDSVLNRSNIGSDGKSKAEQVQNIKELLDSGAIDEDEFKQMKKEILGK
jgi:hypothetical protein